MNFELKVKEITLDVFLLTGKIFNDKIINNLINFVINNKDNELSYKTNVKGHFTGFKSLVDNSDFISFLKIIQQQIKIICNNNFIIQDAWGNLCKKGDEVVEHDHGNSLFCGILYLTEGGPGTYFRDFDYTINEERGKFVLFHPKLLHSVKKIEKDIERISISFNMGEIKKWQNLTDAKFVNQKT
jgi:ectoine hydroxylase-related dioxygenase (phytanoyl-CoA dioxygenase family)